MERESKSSRVACCYLPAPGVLLSGKIKTALVILQLFQVLVLALHDWVRHCILHLATFSTLLLLWAM